MLEGEGLLTRIPGLGYHVKVESPTDRRPRDAGGIVRGQSEPVKAVCDRRATAAVRCLVDVNAKTTLSRICPDQEMVAIGSRDPGGQALDD